MGSRRPSWRASFLPSSRLSPQNIAHSSAAERWREPGGQNLPKHMLALVPQGRLSFSAASEKTNVELFGASPLSLKSAPNLHPTGGYCATGRQCGMGLRVVAPLQGPRSGRHHDGLQNRLNASATPPSPQPLSPFPSPSVRRIRGGKAGDASKGRGQPVVKRSGGLRQRTARKRG